MNIQDLFPLGCTGLIALQSKRLFSNTTVQKHQFFGTQLSLWSNSHPYMTTGNTTALTRWTFVVKEMSLLFNMLSRLVIAFLPRSKRLLISWLQSPSAVVLEPKKMKSVTISIVFPSRITRSCRTYPEWVSAMALSLFLSDYLRLLIFFLAILIPACASSSPAFYMMYSALN